jgi:hypothetical protein
MELIDSRCPNCMGVVSRIRGTNIGECESCGSRFTLPDEKSKRAKDEDVAEEEYEDEEEYDEEEDDEEDGADLEGFFDDFYDEVRRNGDREYSVARELNVGKGATRLEHARKYFEIDNDVDVYLVLDTTIFGSGKVGFAIGDDGFYCRDEDGDVSYLDWDDFDDCDIEVDGSKLTIAGYSFISNDDDADTLFEMLCDLQEL